MQRGFSGGDASQFNQGLETDRLAMQIVKVEALKWVNNDELLDWQSPGVSAPGQYLVPLMIKKNDWCSGVIF